MQDVVYVGLMVAFFALCAMYVRGLDRLVRADDPEDRAVVPAKSHEDGPSQRSGQQR